MVAAGAPILASDINTLLSSNFARKYRSADETEATTTLKADTSLFFTAGVNEIWGFEINCLYSGATTGDFKVALTFPTGAAVPWGIISADSTTTTSTNNVGFSAPASGDSFALGGTGAGNTLLLKIAGTIINSTTAGNLQVQFAMRATDAGQVARMRRGSNLFAWKVA